MLKKKNKLQFLFMAHQVSFSDEHCRNFGKLRSDLLSCRMLLHVTIDHPTKFPIF